jgi:hypothetical protein
VEKIRVFEALASATAACGRKRYSKGKVSFDLLKSIDPAIVEQKCPDAKWLLERRRQA